MANLRGGVQGNRGEATRLASATINVWANTWNRRVDIDLSKDGNLSITVRDDEGDILEVRLPDNEGKQKNSYVPKIKYKGRDLAPELIASKIIVDK